MKEASRGWVALSLDLCERGYTFIKISGESELNTTVASRLPVVQKDYLPKSIDQHTYIKNYISAYKISFT